MASVLKTHVDYNFSRLEELQRAVGRTYARARVRRSRGVILLLGAGLAASGVVLAMRNEPLPPVLVCSILSALLLLRGIFYYPFSALKTMLFMKNRMDNEYILEKDAIRAVHGEDSCRYPYSDCAALLETERHLYFFMNSGQGFMLSKENVQGGTGDELRARIVEKCGKDPTWAGRGKAPA